MRFVLACLTVSLALSACAGEQDGQSTDSNRPEGVDSNRLRIDVIDTPYGPMLCVIYTAGYKGGLSCEPLGWDPTTTPVKP
jgi:hypothetical protein